MARESRDRMGGKDSTFRYTKGFVCDTAVKSFATSDCEAGAPAEHQPRGGIDPLYG